LGCIEAKQRTPDVVRLTVKGWDRLDPGSAGAGIRGRVFVAMSFDPSLDEVYAQGIKAAIEQDCGMTPIRVDKLHQNEKICDRVLAEIRRSQFVVADVTQQKAGVYFEAGFAMGLGRRVIWCCREDEKNRLHFDTRQYPHLLWTDAADLRRKLAESIQAQFPR
jgi:nucleoside 2-deoxyribosyltransferase